MSTGLGREKRNKVSRRHADIQPKCTNLKRTSMYDMHVGGFTIV